MWPASHSRLLADVEDLHAVGVGGPALVQLGHGHALDALDVELLLAPRGHAAGEVAGDVAQADGGGERRAPRCASSSSRPTSTSRCSGSASHASLEPKPARRDGDAHRAGDVRLVELQLGAHVDHERAVAERLLRPGAASAGAASTVSSTSGPRLSATMFWKFGGCGPSADVVARHELVLVGDRAAGPCGRARSRSSRRPSCPCPGRRTASRPGGRARPRSCRAAPAACR